MKNQRDEKGWALYAIDGKRAAGVCNDAGAMSGQFEYSVELFWRIEKDKSIKPMLGALVRHGV